MPNSFASQLEPFPLSELVAIQKDIDRQIASLREFGGSPKFDSHRLQLRLYRKLIESQVDDLKSSVQGAEGQIQLSSEKLRELERLFENGVIPSSELNDAKQAVRIAQSELIKLRNRLEYFQSLSDEIQKVEKSIPKQKVENDIGSELKEAKAGVDEQDGENGLLDNPKTKSVKKPSSGRQRDELAPAR